MIVRCQKEQVTALEAIERGRTRAIVSASRVSLGRAHRMIDRMRALLSARAANEIPGRSGAG